MLPLPTGFHFGNSLLVTDSFEDGDLIEEGASLRLGLDIFDLECGQLIVFVFDFVDFAERAFTYLSKKLVFGVESVVILDELFHDLGLT